MSPSPASGPIRPFHLPPIGSRKLANGLVLKTMERGGSPLVSAVLVLGTGEARVPESRAGLAVLTGDALQGGTRTRDGAALAEALERLGTSLSVSTGWEATTARFTCVAERLGPMLALLAEVVRSPAFPDDEVERIRRQRLAVVRQRRMDPDSLADDALDGVVFPAGHPYHRPVAGTDASVASLGPEEVRGHAARAYGPVGGGLAVVGDLGAGDVAALAAEHLGSWTGGTAGGAGPLPEVEAADREIVVVNRPGSVQSELRVGHTGPARGHEDEVPLQVANLVLGGAFTSRLNLSLREERGFTYGARSGFAFRLGGGLFSIGTAVQTEVTAPALAETMAVFAKFAEEGPTTEEIERSRDYLAGVFPLRMETTSQLASRVAELLVYGLPDDYHHRYRDAVRGVTPGRAGEAIRGHLRPERASIVVVGDAERVVPELEGLGLGVVRVVDP